MRRLLSTVASTAILMTPWVTMSGRVAAWADTTAHLPLTSALSDMAVDESANHLFFTAAGGTSVYVTDLSGANPSTVDSLPGASGLAVSADGSTVYVAVSGAGDVVAIDATTLHVTATYTGMQCPADVALAGGKLWFSDGCGAGSIGSVDTSTIPATVTRAVVPDTWSAAPRLASGGAGTSVLAAGESGVSPSQLATYDVSGATPRLLAKVDDPNVCSNLGSLAVSPSGADVAVACGSPYHVSVLKAADLSAEGYYGESSPYPAAAAVSSDGGFVAAGFSQHTPNVQVFPWGQPAPTASYDLEAGGHGLLPADALRFGPSGDLYAVVPTSVDNNDFDLMVLHGATLYPATVTVGATPAAPARGQTVQVSGTLSSASPIAEGQALQVSRHDLSGTTALPPTTTGAGGSFGFSDAPTIGGPVTYTVSWAGDGTHRTARGGTTVQVARVATTISIASNAARYSYRARAYVSVHLGATYNSRVVSIYATPYRGSRRLLRSAAVNSHGTLVASYVVTRRTRFTAVFAGDYRHAPASASTTVLVHARLVEQLQDYYATSSGYRLYHRRSNPTLAVQLFPLQGNVCIYFRAQRYYGGGWHTTATSPCFRTDTAGQAAAVLIRNHVVGEPYRLRAEWRGDATSLARVGAWTKLKFT